MTSTGTCAVTGSDLRSRQRESPSSSDVPGMTGLLDAAAVLRTRQAWAIVAPLFDAPARAAIQAAAAALTEADRSAALAGVQDDARRYGLPADQIAAALYPPRAVPSLDDLLSEVP